MSEDVTAVGLSATVAKVEVPQDNPEANATAKANDEPGDEPRPQGNTNEGDPEPDKPRKKGGWQRKIERQQQIIDLLLEQAGLRQSQPVAQPAPAEPAAPKKDELGPEPQPEDFETVAEYLKAARAYDRKVLAHELKQEQAAERAKEQTKTAEQQAKEAWEAKAKMAREKYGDFDEVISDPDLPVSKPMYDVLVEDEAGAELAYYLGKHPEEAERISKLGPARAAVELGLIKARIAPQDPAEKTPPPVTKAPPPPTPIKKTTTVAAPFDPNDEKQAQGMTAEEWVAKRYAYLRKKGAQ